MKTTPSPEKGLGTIPKIPLKDIKVSPYQPRHNFCKESLQELAASILEVGLLQPLVLRPSPCGEGYEIIAGERRFRACHLAGLETAPAYINERSDVHSAQAALIENVQRKDLNPLEIAQALQKLIDNHSFSQQVLAKKIGKQRSTVANYLRLLLLPKKIQESLGKGLITMGHAKAILTASNIEKQRSLHDKIIRDGLTVRQAEDLASKLSKNTKEKKQHTFIQTQNFYLDVLAEKLQRSLGSKVKILEMGKKRGKVIIEYYGWDDLENLMKKFEIDIDNE